MVDQTQSGTLQGLCLNGQQLELGEEGCGSLKHLDMVDYCSCTREGLLSDGTRHDHRSLVHEGRQNSQID